MTTLPRPGNCTNSVFCRGSTDDVLECRIYHRFAVLTNFNNMDRGNNHDLKPILKNINKNKLIKRRSTIGLHVNNEACHSSGSGPQLDS